MNVQLCWIRKTVQHNRSKYLVHLLISNTAVPAGNAHGDFPFERQSHNVIAIVRAARRYSCTVHVRMGERATINLPWQIHVQLVCLSWLLCGMSDQARLQVIARMQIHSLDFKPQCRNLTLTSEICGFLLPATCFLTYWLYCTCSCYPQA